MRICGGRPVRWAGVLFLLSLGPQSPSAAPRLAAVLGPEVAIGEPSGGYVGRLIVAPDHGPTGTPLTVTAEARCRRWRIGRTSTRIRQATASLRLNWLVRTQNGPF